MQLPTLAYVALGGAIGASLRYLVAIGMTKYAGIHFPYGTLTANLLGSFLMGVWIGYIALTTPSHQRELHLLIAVGILGGFTTFSTFSLDAYSLYERGLVTQAAGYVIGSVVGGLLSLMAGMAIMHKIGA